MDIASWRQLSMARAQAAGFDRPEAQADCTELLRWATGQSATWLRTWSDHALSSQTLAQLDAGLTRRLQGEPMAYIVGSAGFRQLDLKVTPDTLVPRADTELLVELALACGADLAAANVIDLGTGTGAIALALKEERPRWQLKATDRSAAALAVAQENAEALALAVNFIETSWLDAVLDESFDLIVSNPPYIDANDPHLSGLGVRHEPRSALVAADQGLADIKQIATQAPACLKAGGWLLLEHGFDQGAAVRDVLQGVGFTQVRTERDLGQRDRVTLGCWQGGCWQGGMSRC